MKFIKKIYNFSLDWPLLYYSLIALCGFVIATTIGSKAIIYCLFLLCLFSFAGIVSKSRKFALLAVASILIIVLSNIWTQIKTYEINENSATIKNEPAWVASIPNKTTHGYSADIILSDESRFKIFYNSSNLNYGDNIVISGEIPEINSEFPTKAYLYVNGVEGIVFATRITHEYRDSKANKILFGIYKIRSSIIKLSGEIFSSQSAGIVNAMIFGDTGLIDSQTEEKFLKTGTTHLLVVSGANVILIAWITKSILSALGINFARLTSLVVILGFIVFTGAEPSIVRAGIIFILITSAELIGRKPHFPTLLSITALSMAIINPWILFYDITFQLSFGAVIGLILFSKKLESLIPIPLLSGILAGTLAASIFTIPIIALYFGQISTVFLIANILVLPLVPLITFSGILALTLPFLPAIAWMANGIAMILIDMLGFVALPKFSLITIDNKFLAFTIVVLIFAPIVVKLVNMKTLEPKS